MELLFDFLDYLFVLFLKLFLKEKNVKGLLKMKCFDLD